jgi:hypothetical protein
VTNSEITERRVGGCDERAASGEHHHLWFHICVWNHVALVSFVRVWNECVIVSCVKKVCVKKVE